MLESAPLAAFIPVSNLTRARQSYGFTLGLQVTGKTPLPFTLLNSCVKCSVRRVDASPAIRSEGGDARSGSIRWSRWSWPTQRWSDRRSCRRRTVAHLHPAEHREDQASLPGVALLVAAMALYPARRRIWSARVDWARGNTSPPSPR